jgi:hypothetical protein
MKSPHRLDQSRLGELERIKQEYHAETMRLTKEINQLELVLSRYESNISVLKRPQTGGFVGDGISRDEKEARRSAEIAQYEEFRQKVQLQIADLKAEYESVRELSIQSRGLHDNCAKIFGVSTHRFDQVSAQRAHMLTRSSGREFILGASDDADAGSATKGGNAPQTSTYQISGNDDGSQVIRAARGELGAAGVDFSGSGEPSDKRLREEADKLRPK